MAGEPSRPARAAARSAAVAPLGVPAAPGATGPRSAHARGAGAGVPTGAAGSALESAGRARTTSQATALTAVLADAGGFRSAQDLHAALRAQGRAVGLTTVYRRLTALVAAGQVDVLHTADGEAVYRSCQSVRHHHHVVCRHCRATVEVDGPEVEAWAEAVARAHGFRDVTHTVEVFGTCAGCASGATGG